MDFITRMNDFMNTTISTLSLSTLALTTMLTLSSFSATVSANGVDTPISAVAVLERQLVSLNESTLDELMTLKGIGKKKAQAILAYRKLYGDFKSIEELMDVKGIGHKIVNENKLRLKI